MKNLMHLEMPICFGPIFTMLMVGLLLVLPEQLRYLFVNVNRASVMTVAFMVGGVCGFVGLMIVVLKVFDPDKVVLHRGITLTLVGIGIVTLLSYGVFAIGVGALSERSINAFIVLVVLPSVGSLHVLYLARAYL